MYKQLVNQQNKSLLAISVALALNTNVVFAETVTPVANSEFETLEITGSRYQRSTDEILASVVVIDRSDIDSIQPQSMSDLLQTIAGVDITRQGGFRLCKFAVANGACPHSLSSSCCLLP